MKHLQKVLKNHADHKNMTKPKPKQCLDAHLCFIVEHYAGPVAYNVTNFLEKNKDAIGDDVKKMFKRSKDTVVAALFAKGEGDEDSKRGARSLRYPSCHCTS